MSPSKPWLALNTFSFFFFKVRNTFWDWPKVSDGPLFAWLATPRETKVITPNFFVGNARIFGMDHGDWLNPWLAVGFSARGLGASKREELRSTAAPGSLPRGAQRERGLGVCGVHLLHAFFWSK